MNCVRPDCGHPAKIHRDDGPCRKTGCKCEALTFPEPEEVKLIGGNRICVDVPDGYMLTVSLVPYTEPPREEPPPTPTE